MSDKRTNEEDNENGQKIVENREENEDNGRDQSNGEEESEEQLVVTKKRKIVPFEEVYINNLCSSESYERSYMHRDVVSHVLVTTTDFIITASLDGHIKFWKKQST